MTYRGHIKHGVVVLDGHPPLEEGTLVRVEAIEQPSRRYPRGSADAVLEHAGAWKGQDEEIDRLLAELRQSKQEELKAQLNEPEPEL